MRTLWQDLRYAARMLTKKSGSTLVIALTLALGIGASTAIFGALNPILSEPLPYPEAHRLVSLIKVNSGGTRVPGTFGMYRGLVERNRSFEALAVFRR